MATTTTASTTEAANDAANRRLAEEVWSRGNLSGGTWQAEVTIEQPGKTPVEVTFLLVLEGSH